MTYIFPSMLRGGFGTPTLEVMPLHKVGQGLGTPTAEVISLPNVGQSTGTPTAEVTTQHSNCAFGHRILCMMLLVVVLAQSAEAQATCANYACPAGVLKVNYESTNYTLDNCCKASCPERFFASGYGITGRVCGHCAPYCSHCHNESICLECTDGLYLHDSRCTYNCPLGTVHRGENTTGRYCLPCGEHCALCSDPDTCRICTDYKFLYDSHCVTKCPQNSTTVDAGLFGSVCKPCKDYCVSCPISDTICTKCLTGRYLHNDDCIESCPIRTFASESDQMGWSCQACDGTCSSCTNASMCLVCDGGKYLSNSKCEDQCPQGSSPVGDGSAGRICRVCKVSECSRCSASADICTECRAGYHLYEGTCLSSCPSGTRPMVDGLAGLTCGACDDKSCFSCPEASNICTKCNERYLHNGGCVTSCPVRTFANELASLGWSCEACSTSCLSCTNASFCDECADSMYLLNSACRKSCPPGSSAVGVGSAGRLCRVCQISNCSRCPISADVCTECRHGKYLFEDKCYASCPSGTVRNEDGSRDGVGLTCIAPDNCAFGFKSSDESGSCELDWLLLSGIAAATVVLFFFFVIVFIRRKALKRLSLGVDANKEKQIEEALRAAKRVFIPESNATVKAARRQHKILMGKYTDYERMLQILERGVVFGDMKLVRGSWLMDPQNISRFRRQQELPNEAFWNPDELRSQLTVVSIVAISYCWLHPINPDPHGKHLRELQRAIRLRLNLRGPGQIQDLAIFLDFASIPQHGEQGDENEPVRGAYRTESEEAAFKIGLKSVNIPYASQLVETWMMQWVPDDEPRKYMSRGWPFFEQAVSSLIKPATMLINIDERVFEVDSWIDVHEKGKIGRKPPLIPSVFREALSTKSFTNGKTDENFVADKYTETFKDVVGMATALWFVGLGWKDEDAVCFTEVFQFAAQLERLLLSDNALSAIGAEAIIRGSADCASLKHLDLADNQINEDEFDGLVQLWQSLGKPAKGLRLAASQQRRPSRLSGQIIGNVEMPADSCETLVQVEIGDRQLVEDDVRVEHEKHILYM